MTPYYEDGLVTIYHGDASEWGPEPVDAVVTDPPYGRAALPLWCLLGRIAAAALRPEPAFAAAIIRAASPDKGEPR